MLALVAQHLGTVHVPRALLAEVEQLNEGECRRLGFVLVDGSVEQLLEAGQRRGQGGLSFEDQLCLVLARDAGWTCVSNDGPLRRACQRNKVPVRWGLELMLELVARGHLPAETAIEVAESIHRTNRRYITRVVVDEFIKKARGVSQARP